MRYLDEGEKALAPPFDAEEEEDEAAEEADEEDENGAALVADA